MAISKRSLLAKCQVDQHDRVRKILYWHSQLPTENRAEVVESWLSQLLDQVDLGLEEQTLFTTSLPALMSGREVDIQIDPCHDQMRLVSVYCELNQSSFSGRSTDRMAAVFDSLYRSSLDSLITIDTHGKIIEFNRAAENMFGYRRDEVHGRSVAEIVIPHAMRDAHHAGMERYLATGEGPVINNRVEVEALRRDGSLFPCELTVVPAQINGETAFFSAFIRDISARKAAEDALKRAKEAAEAASEAKSRFLAHMSHEIRSPVSAVLGCLELLSDSALTEEQNILVETAEDSGHNLLNMIEDVLNFSKIESGTYQLQPRAFNPVRLIDQILETVAIRSTNNVYLGSCIDPAIPTELVSDPVALRQIITNLVENALKFTDAGGVSVRLYCQGGRSGGSHQDLRIQVIDTGPGISAEFQETIFEEFGQVDSSDRTVHGGTGLGLAICRRLAEALGGHISLNSQLGHGSCFQVIIPCEVTPQAKPFFSVEQQLPPVNLYAHNKALGSDIEEQIRLCGGQLSRLTAPASSQDIVVIEYTPSEGAIEDAIAAWAAHAVDPGKLVVALHQQELETTLDAKKLGVRAVLRRPLTAKNLLSALQFEQAPDQTQSITREAGVQPQKLWRILVAEDSKANQLIATTMLRQAGYQVDIAENGREAVAAVEKTAYDAILMDLRMPLMDGLEATRLIRERKSQEELPVIALTANVFGSDVDRCFEAGMNDFLSKPVNREKMLSVLANWLEDGARETIAERETETVLELLDNDVLLQLGRDTSEEAVAVILQAFQSELRTFEVTLKELSGPVELSDVAQLREMAHRCKSSAGYCGALRVQDMAASLEKACVDERLDQVSQLLDSVRICASETLEAVTLRVDQAL